MIIGYTQFLRHVDMTIISLTFLSAHNSYFTLYKTDSMLNDESC